MAESLVAMNVDKEVTLHVIAQGREVQDVDQAVPEAEAEAALVHVKEEIETVTEIAKEIVTEIATEIVTETATEIVTENVTENATENAAGNKAKHTKKKNNGGHPKHPQPSHTHKNEYNKRKNGGVRASLALHLLLLLNFFSHSHRYLFFPILFCVRCDPGLISCFHLPIRPRPFCTLAFVVCTKLLPAA